MKQMVFVKKTLTEKNKPEIIKDKNNNFPS